MAKRKTDASGIEARTGAMNLEPGAAAIAIEPGSGNVFADLGLPDAVELDTKVRLAVAINQRIGARHLSQVAAARALGVNQPKISALKNYRMDGFSVERLLTDVSHGARERH